MQPGNLIKITRASIGVPEGTLALIVKSDLPERWVGDSAAAREVIYTVQLIGNKTVHAAVGHRRRYLGRDLEVISESR